MPRQNKSSDFKKPDAFLMLGSQRGISLIFFLLLLSLSGLKAQVITTDTLSHGDDSTQIDKTSVIEEMKSSDSSSVLITEGEVTDTVGATKDSAKVGRKGFHALHLHLSPKKDVYDPKVALTRSAILPGWGQVYNNRIWKLPIIYGGFGVFIAFIIGNNQGYKEYDDAVKCKGDTNCVDDPFPGYSIANVITIREDYRRIRDLNFILCGLWYVLNLVDAYVDAHLRGFNVSDDLTLDLNPNLRIDPFGQKRMVVGASLTLSLRR